MPQPIFSILKSNKPLKIYSEKETGRTQFIMGHRHIEYLFEALVHWFDGDVAIPNWIAMVLKTKMACFIFSEFLPSLKFAGVYLFIPVFASEFSFNNFFSVEPVLN